MLHSRLPGQLKHSIARPTRQAEAPSARHGHQAAQANLAEIGSNGKLLKPPFRLNECLSRMSGLLVIASTTFSISPAREQS